MGVPQITHNRAILILKTMVLGIPQFRKPGYRYLPYMIYMYFICIDILYSGSIMKQGRTKNRNQQTQAN